MPKIFLRIAAGLVFGCLVAWMFWRFLGGPAGLVFAAPVFGVLLARPIIDLVAETSYAGKAHALASLQGRNWSHRGSRIDIAEDIENRRWLLTKDVRKVIPALPRDEVLLKQFIDRAGSVDGYTGVRIRADALADYLLKATDSPSLKFKTWLDREVMGGSLNPRKP